MGGGSEGPRPITSVLNRYLFAELYAAIAPGDSRELGRAWGQASNIMATAAAIMMQAHRLAVLDRFCRSGCFAPIGCRFAALAQLRIVSIDRNGRCDGYRKRCRLNIMREGLAKYCSAAAKLWQMNQHILTAG